MWSPPDQDIDMADVDETLDEQLLLARHAEAQHSYDIKVTKIPGRSMLEILYLKPEQAAYSRAPLNLQLPVYLALYNQIAAASFVAQKHLAWDTNEAI